MPVAPYVAASSDSESEPNHISDALRVRLQATGPRARLAPVNRPLSLPAPVFPQYPDKVGDVEPPAKYQPQPGNPYRTRASTSVIARALLPVLLRDRGLGGVGAPRFDVRELNEMKVTCQKHCFSTLNHNLAYCYKPSRAIKWVLRQAAHGFQGARGGFED